MPGRSGIIAERIRILSRLARANGDGVAGFTGHVGLAVAVGSGLGCAKMADL
jgi:hypothetical protein